MSRHVAVIGGGISGLTAAYRLRQRLGESVMITVCESTGSLGGKLRTATLADRPLDVGAEAFLARRPEALALVEEIGLGPALTHPTSARSTVRAGGVNLRIPPGTLMGVPGSPESVTGLLSADGVRAVAAEAGLPPVSLPGGGDVALGPLLRARFGDELVDRLVDPLLGGVYAGGADGLGLRATMPALAAALDAGAPSLTAAASAVLPAEPSAAPVFAALTGGMGTLVERLVRLSGARVRLGIPVRELRRRAEGGWRLLLGAAAPAHAPEVPQFDADAVVLALPAPQAGRLLARVEPAAAAALGEIELASMAVVSLALPPGTELPEASGLLIGAAERRADGSSFATKAFTFSARKWAHLHAAGAPLPIRGSVGRFADPGALRADDPELVRLVRRDLAELTGVDAEPVDVLVTRWGGGLPQYGPGHRERVERVERAVRRVRGLEIAGAALHGVGIPACIATANAAATRLASEFGSRN
ncbi:oxygen-dependent protoporphyrinogen oxidase [Amycolatopsis marina]|uniref:Coproporphyrinogen III oxidase n=1 Tax=Amycolatopsis marina TaxID=490629 RepID=A0A1I1B9A0_9PSEU|nr:protoporphyrinogen oxidase [Amycolatopsis marina]SFB45268.1 oxygen-dependent protoporphyrinogen oxidase [Amycolatopsis marina]